MATKTEERTFEDAVQWLRDHGFDLIEAPGMQGRVFLREYNVSAAIQKDGDDGVKIFAYPGYLISGEISKLVNRGYQQVLKTSKTELAPTADHRKALQQVAEELKEALSLPSLSSDRIGTASLILAVTIGLTGKQYILNQIQGIGANEIYAEYEGGAQRITNTASDPLTVDDLLSAQAQVSGIVAASPVVTLADRISVGE